MMALRSNLNPFLFSIFFVTHKLALFRGWCNNSTYNLIIILFDRTAQARLVTNIRFFFVISKITVRQAWYGQRRVYPSAQISLILISSLASPMKITKENNFQYVFFHFLSIFKYFSLVFFNLTINPVFRTSFFVSYKNIWKKVIAS